jgi:hypothetical protein
VTKAWFEVAAKIFGRAGAIIEPEVRSEAPTRPGPRAGVTGAGHKRPGRPARTEAGRTEADDPDRS